MRNSAEFCAEFCRIPHSHDIDLPAVSETWLDFSVPDALVHVPGYNIHRYDCLIGQGGRACFFVKESTAVRHCLHSHTAEAVFITVLDKKRPILLLGCVYRSPSAPVFYWSFLTESIEKLLSISSCDLILQVDFNVNILSPTPSTQHRYLNNLISDFNLPIMTKSPTRTPSQLCLDLILAPVHLRKDYKVISSSITSLDGLTDHHLFGISIALPLHSSPRKKHVQKYRSPPLHKADFQGLLGHISR